MTYKLTSAQRDELRRAVKSVSYTRDKERAHLNGVELRVLGELQLEDPKPDSNRMYVTSTDGHRLSQVEILIDEVAEFGEWSLVLDAASYDVPIPPEEGPREMLWEAHCGFVGRKMFCENPHCKKVLDAHSTADITMESGGQMLGSQLICKTCFDKTAKHIVKRAEELNATLTCVYGWHFLSDGRYKEPTKFPLLGALLRAETVEFDIPARSIILDGTTYKNIGSDTFPEWRDVMPKSSRQVLQGECRELEKLASAIVNRTREVNKVRKTRSKERKKELRAKLKDATDADVKRKLRGAIQNENPALEYNSMVLNVSDASVSVTVNERVPHSDVGFAPEQENFLKTFFGGEEELHIGLNAKYVYDAVKVLRQASSARSLELQLNDKLDPVVFTDGKAKVVLMPMRL